MATFYNLVLSKDFIIHYASPFYNDFVSRLADSFRDGVREDSRFLSLQPIIISSSYQTKAQSFAEQLQKFQGWNIMQLFEKHRVNWALSALEHNTSKCINLHHQTIV